MDSKWYPWLLAAVTLLIFWQTSSFTFLNFDDDAYVTANPQVVNGLTADSVQWALTSSDRIYWHPLTFLSLMTDVALFGVQPGPIHLVNALLHALTTCILYFALSKLTGSSEKSFVVALLWAVHPLRVESVAWIAERKDVLSGLLMVVTIFVYQRYVRVPSKKSLAAVFLFYLLAIAAKPMAVILPVLLVILDFWPLRRWAPLEKLPFVGVAGMVSVATYVSQRNVGALDLVGPLSVSTRLANAVHSIGLYIAKTVWPVDLVILYPYQSEIPNVVLIAAALLVVTGIAVWQWNRRPWLLAGWTWFIVGLVPTLGLVQAGMQSMADRFTYIPQIGLIVMIVWTAAEFLPRAMQSKAVVITACSLAVVAYLQTATWRDNLTVYAHALAHSRDNWLAELKYGMALSEAKELGTAETHLRRAADLKPSDPHSRFHLGRVAAFQRNPAAAEDWFRQTVERKPDYADAHFSRAAMLMQLGREDEALSAAQQAIHVGLTPEWAAQANNLAGTVLARKGRAGEAVSYFREAVRLQPGLTSARQNLAIAERQSR